MSLLEELKRRGVLRVGSAYVVGAWLLAQVAEFLTETFAAPLWVLRTLVVCLGVGVVPVLVFSWMFEFTPQGLRRQAELDRAGIVISRAGRRIDYLIAVLLLAAAGWLAFSWSQRMRIAEEATAVAPASAPSATPAEASAPAAPANSIAVLPFLNLSTAPDSDVLADGIAEELLGVLGRNRGLRVTARSSAFRFKDQNRDLREVGRLLGVRFVLEGSVRLAAQRVKIGTQLVDAASGVQLWSETYDRTLADLFALQEDIAGEVAKALQVVLTANSATPGASGTTSIEAHMELLRARQVAATRKIDDLAQAIERLQRAIVLDPAYVDAYVELAYATGTRALQLGEELDARAELEPLIDKALALDPRSGAALVLRGASLIDDPVVAERTMREGLALAPSHARGYELLAQAVAHDPSRLDEALALLDQAIALDPLSPRNHQVKGILLLNGKGDYDRAETHFLRAVELEPRFRMGMVQLSMLNMTRGSFAAAVDYAERALEIEASAQFRNELVAQYLNIGDLEAARAANVPASLHAELEIMLFTGDTAGGMKRVRAHGGELRRAYGISPVLVTLHRDAASGGDWAANLELAAKAIDYTDELPSEVTAFGFNAAVMAALLRGAGRTAEADRLSTWLLAQLATMEQHAPAWQRGPINWARAMVLAQTGRDAEALDALEIAFSPARPYWWALLDRNPMFDHLRADPRYEELRTRLQQYLMAQRVLLAEKRGARVVDSAPVAGSRGPG